MNAKQNDSFDIKRYTPLFVLIAVAGLGALALAFGRAIVQMDWLQFFMGLLFCQFSMLKLFNLPQFAEGFQTYDWIAKRAPLYAFAYPFIELVLGLIYLSGYGGVILNIVTMILMVIGALGVFQALKRGLDVRCVCMGTVLNVPLSTVTLTEDLGMGIMALMLLIF